MRKITEAERHHLIRSVPQFHYHREYMGRWLQENYDEVVRYFIYGVEGQPDLPDPPEETQ